MFYKEFSEIKVNNDYLLELANTIIENDSWESIRRLQKRDKFNFEFSGLDMVENTDPAKRREYLARVVFAHRMDAEEREKAGIQANSAWMFKTNINTRVYVHRESRAIALNFPVIFEPGKSFVGFYDDKLNELSRHTLNEPNAVYYNVENWHAVINESLLLPRIVLTCSDLTGDWKDKVYHDIA